MTFNTKAEAVKFANSHVPGVHTFHKAFYSTLYGAWSVGVFVMEDAE